MPVSATNQSAIIADIFGNADRRAGQVGLGVALENAKKPGADTSHISQAAQDFEAVFLGHMLQAMMPEEGDSDSLFNNKESDAIFRGMMMEEYARELAKSGGIGIASYIEREMLGQHSVQQTPRDYKLAIGSYQQQADIAAEAVDSTSKGEEL